MSTKDTKPKILFCSFEATPFVKTGGLGDVAGSLPAALNAQGANARLIMPKLGTIAREYTDRMRHVADFTVQLGWRSQYCGIESLRLGGVTVYFIDNEYYFKRDKAYGYYDDAERVAFFSKAILESLPYLKGFFPDVLHLNDWHTAMVPAYLKTLFASDSRYERLKTVFTVHNLRFQGQFDPAITGDVLGLNFQEANNHGLFRGGCLNMLHSAVCCADIISTVSPTYAQEICTAQYGEKLEDVFLSRKDKLWGILNGIDTKAYDTAKDKTLAHRFASGDPSGKAANKAALQAELGLPQTKDVPLAVLVSRLTDQKGLDLVLHVVEEMLETGMQLAILGTGDEKYEQAFAAIAMRHPNQMAVVLKFDEALSHRMYAGGDMVMVPSAFEPCGLTQLYGLRYGALPIVRETGGLKDSVVPYNKYTGEGTGFSFANYNAHELLYTVQAAVKLYQEDPAAWETLVKRAMAQDFSWSASAEKYMAMYSQLL